MMQLNVTTKTPMVSTKRLSPSTSLILVAVFVVPLFLFGLSLTRLISLSSHISSLTFAARNNLNLNSSGNTSFPLSLQLSLNFPTSMSKASPEGHDETESPYPTPVLRLPPLPASDISMNTTVRSFFATAPYPSLHADQLSAPPAFFVTARRAGAPEITHCTFHGACVAANGSLLLHPRLAMHEERITAVCGAVELAYFERFDGTHRTAATHLLGARPLRHHIPHFMTDAVSAQLASEIVFGNGSDSHETIPSDTTDLEATETRNSFTALYVDNDVIDSKLSSWIPRAAALLHGPPVLVSPLTLFGAGGSGGNLSCFAAVTTLPRPGRGGNYSALLSRAPAFNAAAGQSTLWRNGVCRPVVTVLDRAAVSDGKFHGRNLHGAANMTRIVLANSSTLIRPSVRRAYFEGVSLSEQAALVRRSHLLVGVHGAALANVVFASVGTTLLELFPYSYYPVLFEEFANWYGLRYDFVVSAPDDDVFWKCMRARGAENMKNISRFETVWRQEHEEHGNKSRNSDILVWSEPIVRSVEQTAARACTRMQRLRFDPEDLARIVWAHIDRICKKKVR